MIPPIREQDAADIHKQRSDLMIHRFATRGVVTFS
jgi:hypothetical protein